MDKCDTTIDALVPMKAHSERVIDKNIRDFAGEPLFCHVINEILKSPYVREIIVDTDSDIIKSEISSRYAGEKIRVIDRPTKLRGDFAPFFDILEYDMGLSDSEIFLQTHATNPLLTEETISNACKFYIDNIDEYDSLFTVNEWHTRLYDVNGKAINHDPDNLIRTQDLSPIYEENSNLYIFTKESFSKRHNRVGLRPYLYPMSMIESVDIDTEDEFTLAEAIYQSRIGR